MPVSLRQIAANTATVTFEVSLTAEDGSITREKVTMRYYPGRITEKTILRFQAMANMDAASIEQSYASFNEAIVNLIASWDVLLDDTVDPPVMFPLDAKRFAELPIGFRLEVITAIMNDIRPEALAPQAHRQNGSL